MNPKILTHLPRDHRVKLNFSTKIDKSIVLIYMFNKSFSAVTSLRFSVLGHLGKFHFPSTKYSNYSGAKHFGKTLHLINTDISQIRSSHSPIQQPCHLFEATVNSF